MSLLPQPLNAAQLRLTAASAVATLTAALTLWPVFTGRQWLPDAILAIVVVGVVGGLMRWLGLGRIAIVGVQLVAMLGLLTARFAPEDAWFGIVPSTTTLRTLVDLAQAGSTSINVQTAPVIAVPGIVLLVTIGIGLAAIEVDLTSVGCRCPAISGVVLLAMYGVTVAVIPGGASWLGFAFAAAGWLLVLYAGRRESLRDWANAVVAPSPGWSAWFGGMDAARDPRAILGRRIAVTAILASVLVAAAVPGVGEGVVGRFTHTDGEGGAGAAGAVHLNLSATIKRNLQSKTNTNLLTYRTNDSSPQYLRLTVLDRFDGVAWQPARLPVAAPSTNDGPQLIEGLDADIRDRTVLLTSITTLGKTRDLSYAPAPYMPVQVGELSSEWLWDNSTSTVFSRTRHLGSTTYSVQSEFVEPTAAQLSKQKGATQARPADLRSPTGLPQMLSQIASTAVEGATTDYAKAVRLQGYFRSYFHYSTDAPPTDTATAITEFLTSRVGYCQQFAATYALMARSVGLASRVVVGFAPGTPTGDGSYVVGTHDYHAWPEVWFDHVGWVRFEPTPRTGAGSTVSVPDWSLPGPFAPATGPSASASATPTASASPTTRTDRRPTSDAIATVTSSRSVADRLQPVGVLLAILAVVGLAVTPALVRASRRRRRLSIPPGAAAVEAAWDELADTARDLGLPWAESDTPRRTADAFVRGAGLDGEAAAAVQTLRRDVEFSRYAGRRDGTGESAAAVRTVRTELLRSSRPSDRWRALLAPATALRRRR